MEMDFDTNLLTLTHSVIFLFSVAPQVWMSNNECRNESGSGGSNTSDIARIKGQKDRTLHVRPYQQV